MMDNQKYDNKNNNILVLVDSKNSKIDKTSMIIFLLIIIVSSIGFLGANAVPLENYVGSETCGKCHVTQYDEWNNTAHSQAYTNPIFQEQWQEQGSPEVCLSCHTTHYDATSGDFEFENVGCELCHTPRSENMVGDVASNACGDCHSALHYPTYTEWLESEHSHQGVGCDSCHDPMTLEILAIDPNTLCKGCHSTEEFESLSEDHGLEGYECLDCHMSTSLADFENGDNGRTGHSFLPAVPDPDCSECHDVTLDAHTVWGTTNDNCMTCHDDVFMTMLHLLNGTDVAISESSVLCAQCHNDVYYEWSLGIHADSHDATLVCTDCHAPMNPYIMMNKTLPPVKAIALVDEKPDPPIPMTFFFMGILVAIAGAYYVFAVRRS
jgi:nitrate/TMAO reductase-like tetraheme cytochrome c subunit